ncbi:ankyrin repeat domain-containing protein [Flavobacterium sp.]|uniref:ankyrin repeat domain-containing protein n=1 Tax=Flavobacterium sp. TaxID=239 RepID=UPI0025DF357F|nr:ankyrin repeat domain-containing protein [Flavobacterium sp.]
MKKILLIATALFTTNLCLSQVVLNVFDIARKGTVEQVKETLKKTPNAFKTVNDEGFSPLTLACYRSNNEVAKLLIDNGSDINQKNNMGTPLMATVVKGNIEIAKILIAKKANLNETDSNGTTPLIYAVQFQNEEFIKLLLLNNVDKTKIDKNGKTAFEYAVFSKNEQIINLLK